MGPITEHNLTLFLIQFGLLLGICKLVGYLFERMKQSSVTAELLVGILLGPTILGKVAPGIQASLFPNDQVQRSMLETIAWVGNFFLLMETGLEVNFSRIWRQKTQALKISTADLIIPILISFLPMYFLPERYLNAPDQRLLFALFMSAIMTISALPVAIRGLRDMNILKTDVGFLIISALTINDIVGWVFFTIILGMFAHGSIEFGYVGQLILLTVGFTVLSLTIVKHLVDRSVSFLHKHVDNESGLKVTFIILLGVLFGGVFCE
jgi:Kef-type K+ transport system membrane component KefB